MGLTVASDRAGGGDRVGVGGGGGDKDGHSCQVGKTILNTRNKRQLKKVPGSERFNETYFVSVSATKD